MKRLLIIMNGLGMLVLYLKTISTLEQDCKLPYPVIHLSIHFHTRVQTVQLFSPYPVNVASIQLVYTTLPPHVFLPIPPQTHPYSTTPC